MIFEGDNYTLRIKQAHEYFKSHTVLRMERYQIMKEAITGSKLYEVSGAKKRDKMDMEYLKLLRLLK